MSGINSDILIFPEDKNITNPYGEEWNRNDYNKIILDNYYNYYLTKIIFIQALIRGYLLRKK